jgi:FdhE protein
LAEATPALREAATLQGAILRSVYARPSQVVAVSIAPEHAAERLGNGEPLLRGERVPPDVPALEALILQLCGTMRRHGAAPGSADEIAAAIKGRALQVETLARAALEGQASAIRERAAELGLDGEMLCTLLRFSLFPALQQAAARLAPLAAAAPWQRGYCPICGSWPLLGEHRGLEQTRYLRCGMCAAEWTVDRLMCPFCGSRNHEDLGYLHVEGADHLRAVTCERCRGYVKVLASLMAIPPLDLVVQDLATLHLDVIALERGYTPPA